jgi:hypothetical protein
MPETDIPAVTGGLCFPKTILLRSVSDFPDFGFHPVKDNHR